jgi:hypothetical protein
MQVKASHKNNDRARSIDVTREDENLSDTEGADKPEELPQDQITATKSAWALGGDYRAHVVQNIIYCGSQLGVYKLVPAVPGRDGVQDKVFFRGLYAADEVDALRRCCDLS